MKESTKSPTCTDQAGLICDYFFLVSAYYASEYFFGFTGKSAVRLIMPETVAYGAFQQLPVIL
ncbi:MAG: hypothetical protein IKF00_06370 [Solobacterium sp.]|nr:hypothetical protein [Solobacterium sp.]